MATEFINDPLATIDEDKPKAKPTKQEAEADKGFIRDSGKKLPRRRGYKEPTLRPWRVGVVSCPESMRKFVPEPETIEATNEVDAIRIFLNKDEEFRKDMRRRHIRFRFAAEPLFDLDAVKTEILTERAKRKAAQQGKVA